MIEILCSILIKDTEQYTQPNFALAFTSGQSCKEVLSFLKIKSVSSTTSYN